MPSLDPQFVSVSQLSSITSLSTRTLWRRIEAGEIPTVPFPLAVDTV